MSTHSSVSQDARSARGHVVPDPVVIGGHRIGRGEPVFVIAEAGVNHDGSVATALDMVDVATRAGATAVKFQVFRASALASASAPAATYQRSATGTASQRAMLSRLELSEDDFARVADRCRARGILFLATPFATDDVATVVRLGTCAIKIASTDINNTPLLRAAADTGLPMIVSTGASTPREIRIGVDHILRCARGTAPYAPARANAPALVLLHCVSCYPTPLDAANLGAIAALEAAFRVPCGYSDHTRSTQTGGWAVAAGARVVEKHFTIDRARRGPDHAVSLDPDELRDYVSAIRRAEQAMGTGVIGMSPTEADVRAVARKSVVAAADIPAGAILRADMLALKRPGGGIAPDALATVIGRRTRVDIPRDTLLTWDVVA
ncbi:MAG: N-acetylneuraminate synthase family protein [Phycisphaerae bacterium]